MRPIVAQTRPRPGMTLPDARMPTQAITRAQWRCKLARTDAGSPSRPMWPSPGKVSTTAWGLTYGLDSHGMWTVLANQQVMQSTDPLTWSKTALTLYQSGNNYATSSIADLRLHRPRLGE